MVKEKRKTLYERLGRINRKEIKKELIKTLANRKYYPYEYTGELIKHATIITSSHYISAMEKILQEHEMKIPESIKFKPKKYVRNAYYGLRAMGNIKESLLPLYKTLYNDERIDFFKGCWEHKRMKGIWQKGLLTIIKEYIEKGRENK